MLANLTGDLPHLNYDLVLKGIRLLAEDIQDDIKGSVLGVRWWRSVLTQQPSVECKPSFERASASPRTYRIGYLYVSHDAQSCTKDFSAF